MSGASGRRLLLLAPSTGFGGGIERLAAAVQSGWRGPVERLDLYSPDEVEVPEGNLRAKLRFVRRGLLAALRVRPDAVLVLHVNFLPVAMLIRLLGRARVGMWAIGVEVWGQLPWTTRRLIAHCDWRLAISGFSGEWMARRAGVELPSVTVVPLPIEDHMAAAAADSPHGRAGEPEGVGLITVTRLVPEHRYKGYFEVARAMAEVLQRRPSVRWVVVGHGADLPELRALCDRLGIAHAVRLTDRISDSELVDEYRKAQLFVLPSVADPDARPPIGEGFGLVFAEAGAFGLPSIGSTAGGGSLEIVRDGETGINVPPYDDTALVGAILRLVDDPALRARLGEAARRRVTSRHLASHFESALEAACPP